MLSALKRLRLLPSLAIWLSVCVPAPAQTLRAAVVKSEPSAHRAASTSAPAAHVSHTAARKAKPQAYSIAEVRTADLDADGNLDLVAADSGGLRTWINIKGRFVEHQPTRALLRHHTPPGFVTARRASHVEDAVVSAERLALVGDCALIPFVEARSHVRLASSVTLASRPLDAGASRAPPLPARA
jgi:hypothetical protein